MFRSLLGTTLTVLTAGALAAQTGSTPSFEVASIKPAAPMQNGMIRVGMGGDPGRVNYTNVTLKNILSRAYGVKAHQITGPSWLDSERWDVIAKVPDGVPADQVPVMLQNLLADRFKMTIRKENKEQNVYAMVVGKNGPKLTPSKDDNGDAPKPVVVSGPNGQSMSLPKGNGPMMMIANGHMEARKATLTQFCDMLSNMLDRPVVDMTEIKGQYDLTLDVSMEELVAMKGAMSGMRVAAIAGAGGAAPGHNAGPSGDGPAGDAAPGTSIFTAVQQLGLKLDPRKAPMDFIVIDKADRVPTEN